MKMEEEEGRKFFLRQKVKGKKKHGLGDGKTSAPVSVLNFLRRSSVEIGRKSWHPVTSALVCFGTKAPDIFPLPS
jgi:hypothetical protein